jgi:endonuclease/exonuclease/phosphatase family metal-dependent hydrolase
VRVATFNILHGRSPSDGEVDVDRLAAAVRTLDADVLALQEVDRDQPRSGGADLSAVAAEAMGAVESRFVAALAGTPGATWTAATGQEQPGSAGYGVALLSRCPVRSWQTVRLPALPAPVPFRVRGRRPVLVRDEPRVAVLAEVEGPQGPLTVAGTHLSFLPGWNLLQLRSVARALRPAQRALLVGDLNVHAAAAVRTTRMRPLATALTYPADRPDRQIDHVLGRGLAAVSEGRAVELPLSDHRALVVDVRPS